MKEYIAIIRTSTEKQEVESQRKELLDFIRKDGIKESQVEVIGEAGASAIKLDERYRKNLERVYSLIEKGGVKCVYAWALDRIGRNEEVMMKFKNFLIAHDVNLKIVNPSLILKNPDGTVNAGMELAFSLYITLSKQEMEMKKARFARARERNRMNGKFHGAGPQAVLFGYTVDNNGYVQPCPEESAIVTLLFSLYSTGKYSLKSLSKELAERGIKTRCKLRPERIYNYLRNRIYCGTDDRQHYPAIVSEDLFDKCQEVLKTNKSVQSKQYKNSYFGNKLIKCPGCGHSLVCYKDHYKCAYRYRHECPSSIGISTDLMDGFLWHFAKQLELDMLLNQSQDDLKIYENELEILKQKQSSLEEQSSTTDKKISNTKRLYADAMITDEEFREHMARHRQADKDRRDRLLEVKEEIQRVQGNIDRIKQPDSFFGDLANLDFKLASLRDEKKMSEIVHRQIRSVDICYINDGKRGYNITMHASKGIDMNIKYYSNLRTHTRLFINGIPEKNWKSYLIDRTELNRWEQIHKEEEPQSIG